MKNIIQTGLICAILIIFTGDNNNYVYGQAKTESSNKITFTEQLETFKQLGFSLNPGVDTSDINKWGRKEFENEPYSLMYITLGETIERKPWTPITNKCWYIDTEAIKSHGAYVDIIKNLDRITRGALNFKNVKDYVDIEEEKAWVSFIVNGDHYKWNLEVDDDWVDVNLFYKIAKLARKYDTKGKYTYYDTGGQSIVIGYETPESLKKIKAATGLQIKWL